MRVTKARTVPTMNPANRRDQRRGVPRGLGNITGLGGIPAEFRGLTGGTPAGAPGTHFASSVDGRRLMLQIKALAEEG
jgi:hypothetical protein